jgi:hypothetical protein
MAPETEAQRLARLDREACRNSRVKRNLQRSASHRQRELHADWLKQNGAPPAPGKTDTDKT